MPFNVDPSMVNSFQSACDFLFATYNRSNDPILQNYLLRLVRMKLTDRAQIVGSRMELDCWDHIKAALFACFGDKRDLECLEQDLFMAVPNKNPLDFAKRLQVLRSALAQKTNTFPDTHMDAATKYNIQQEQEANHKQIIEKLQIEAAEKENSVRRLKRNFKVFEDEIIESEQKYVNTIEEQKLRIIQLKNEISLFKENDEKFGTDMKNSEEQILQLKKQIKELNDMS
ncbi:unnamed protein product [Ceutorhynchus assimilis]|uniref:Uncharacterized protein n=1 Tax=Ceutorhynchus assimilis TaxID=467358 RepID=A0A9N9QJQ5_9CUCU|nr:unnamed protein product [Ceutorhynchus assimilis]